MATKRRRSKTEDAGDESPLDALFERPPSGDDATGLDEVAASFAVPIGTSSGPQPTALLDTARLEYVGHDGLPHMRVLLERTAIGRHTDNHVQLLDPEVSKEHLVIRRLSNGTYELEDVGSANGTLVNGVRVERRNLVD